MPNALDEVMEASDGIWPSGRSKGAVTSAAIVSGSAPGSCVVTWIVGKSTCGSGATGRNRKPRMPPNKTATPRSEVAIGLEMKSDETFIVAVSA